MFSKDQHFKSKVWLYQGCISIFLAISAVNLPVFPALISTGLLIILCIFNPAVGLGIAICLETASEHFSVQAISNLGTLSRLVTLGAGLGFFLRPSIMTKRLKLKSLVLPFLFLCICAISITYSRVKIASIFNTAVIGLNFFIFFIVLFLNKEKQNEAFKNFLYISLITLLYLSVVTFYMGVIYKESFAVYGMERLSIDKDTNPNQLGIGINQLLPFALYLLIKKNENLVVKFIALFAIIHAAAAIFKIESRNSIICFFFIMTFGTSIYFRMYKGILSKRSLIYLTVLLLIILSFTTLNKDFFSFDWKNRFEKENFRTRTKVVESVWSNVIMKNWLIGVGIGGENEVIEQRKNKLDFRKRFKPSHNMILSIWAQVGIFGLIIFIIMLAQSLICCFISLSKDNKSYPILVCIIASIMLGFAETIFFKKIIWFMMAFSISLSRDLKENYNKK